LVIIDLDSGTVAALRRGQYGEIIGNAALQTLIGNWRAQPQ
jgi:hypothetical protein